MLKLKRVYEAPAHADGYRVLVDRLWPRGLKKEGAGIDLWLKEIAPSPALRTWFGHIPDRFPEFRTRYQAELDANPALAELRAMAHTHKTVTLLYAAKDTEHNHVVVLAEYLRSKK